MLAGRHLLQYCTICEAEYLGLIFLCPDIPPHLVNPAQILVQRVKTLEGTVAQLTPPNREQSEAGAASANIEAVKQQMEALAGSVTALEAGVAALQQQATASGASAEHQEQLQLLQARVEAAEKLQQAGGGSGAVAVLDEVKHNLELQQQAQVASLGAISARLAVVENRLKESEDVPKAVNGQPPAATAAAAAAAVVALDTKVMEMNEDVVAALEDMKQKITPVLQVSKVQAVASTAAVCS